MLGVFYAYQTNAAGIYPTTDRSRGQASHRHGTLRAWAKTDSAGRYTIDTIRPSAYPGTDLPEHVHLHVIEPGCQSYYIDDVMFSDDPRLTKVQIAKLTLGRGGSGIGLPMKTKDGWHVERDIKLGEKIPGHRVCS